MADEGRGGPAWVSFLPPHWRNKLDAATARAISGEFLGTFLFVFLASTGSGTALAVGISYAVASYAVSALSGGHLNPIISIAFALSGHQHAALTGLYVIAQVLAAITASLVEAILLPGVHIGHNSKVTAPGCFPAGLFHTGWIATIVWEFVLTFLFLTVVYGVFIGHQKFAPVAPLAAGLAIYAAIESGGTYTGAILNPVRLIGPAIVFLCGWKIFWFYIFGQLLAAFAAALFAVSNFGTGPAYSDNRDELNDRTGGHLGERLMPEGA